MKVYARHTIGLPVIYAEDDATPVQLRTGFKSELTVPANATLQVATELLRYALHNVDREAVEALAREILDIKEEEKAPTMPRYDPRFNEQDLQSMWEGALEEGSDLGRKEIAELVMDSWDLVSCIAACTVIDGEHSCEPLAEMLQRIDNKGDEEYITGEFLREHDDGDGYPALLDFAKRMGLIDEAEENITDLGREYMESLV